MVFSEIKIAFKTQLFKGYQLVFILAGNSEKRFLPPKCTGGGMKFFKVHFLVTKIEYHDALTEMLKDSNEKLSDALEKLMKEMKKQREMHSANFEPDHVSLLATEQCGEELRNSKIREGLSDHKKLKEEMMEQREMDQKETNDKIDSLKKDHRRKTVGNAIVFPHLEQQKQSNANKFVELEVQKQLNANKFTELEVQKQLNANKFVELEVQKQLNANKFAELAGHQKQQQQNIGA
uniref:Uncharacterized protein n=1 Tax=Globodera rostochiensis TaxID=31243 RepID=A0A914IGJ5_GLORO